MLGRIFSKIIIVGLGLLGSSVGLAARRAESADEIVGLDNLRDHALDALRRGAVDRITDAYSDALALDENDIAKPILLVAAIPVGEIAEELNKAIAIIREQIQNETDRERLFILTETASVQSGIRENLSGKLPENVVFIGSHPIAGSEKSGPLAGNVDLFTGKQVVITPMDKESPRQTEAMIILENFWTRLGAETIRLTAKDHDRILAKTSHLPHLISVLLSEMPSEKETAFIGTGWSGMTRLAESSPAVWRDIFAMNRLSVLAAVQEMESLLSNWKSVLKKGDRNQIFTLLEEAKKRRDALGN